MTPLIVRIHEKHQRDGLTDLTCCLCVEAVRRAEKRPAWFRYLAAKEQFTFLKSTATTLQTLLRSAA